ncbi:unnamed protein product [Prorocentrum cordatum]|uniref:Uncharacterized protein n=2 Tax=Prorocentrum cordatum TaxID=2364126 RepID=A0ABN9WSQ8_9DINO|nr:unnamed protein product [Polarella glacialis]
MAMVDMFSDFGLEVQEAKLRRANERSRTCHRKRMEYARSRGASSVPPRACGLRGAVRAASRTCLSRGAVETGSDLPRISRAEAQGRPCRGHRQKAASVTPMLKAVSSPAVRFLAAPTVSEEEHAWAGDDWKDVELPPAEDAPSTQVASDSEGHAGLEDEDEEDARSALDTSALEEGPQHEVGEVGVDADAPIEMTEDKTEDLLPQAEGAEQCTPQAPAAKDPSKREEILRQIVSRLQEQVAEANHAAGEARTQAQEAELKAAEAEAAAAKASGAPGGSKATLKQARQAEKQMASELRKKRNQAARCQAIKETADRTLREAQEIKERAEDEALAIRARLLGEADLEARAAAELRASEEIARAQAEAEFMLREGSEQLALAWEEMRRQARAEAEEARRAAEEEARAIRERADSEARALRDTVREDVVTLKARAEAEARELAETQAREIKERAMADAKALRARAAEQLREKARRAAEEERRAGEERQARAAAEALRAQRAAEAQARAQALKEAKALEQQRSSQLRKGAERERRRAQLQEREAEAARARAARELAAAKEQAEALLRATRAEAIAKARAEQDAALQAAADARAKAEATVAEANAIRARAEQEAAAAREQLASASAQARAELGALRAEAAATERGGDAQDLEADWEVVGVHPAADEEGWDLA